MSVPEKTRTLEPASQDQNVWSVHAAGLPRPRDARPPSPDGRSHGAMSVKAVDGPPKLQNVYHLRKVGTPKACAMCGKETDSCLGAHRPRPHRSPRR